jgi:hypothetical protein
MAWQPAERFSSCFRRRVIPALLPVARSGSAPTDQSPGRPTGIALAALSLALAQLTAPDLWFSPGPQASGKERVL